MIEELRAHLIEAVRLRLRADVPVGIYLSGGIDSSALAGIAAHLVKEEGLAMGSQDPSQRVCCFSIGFDEESGFDESGASLKTHWPALKLASDVAKRTADWLGVSFHKAQMTEHELASRLEDATYHAEHAYHDLNFIGKYALSEVPRQHGYKVVLTGEGADEQFAGYPLFLPDFIAEPDYSTDGTTGKDELSQEERHEERQRLRDIIKDSYAVIGGSTSQFAEPCLSRLGGLTNPAAMSAFIPSSRLFKSASHPRISPVETIIDNIDVSVREQMIDSWHPVHSAMYMWTKGHLVNQFLSCLGDRSEMAHSIEARTPFLDHKLTEYVNSMPPSLKVRTARTTPSGVPPIPVSANGDRNQEIEPFDYTEKYALREAVKPFVTDEVYKRRKYAYSAPARYDLGGPIQLKLEELLIENRVASLGFVSWTQVEKMKKQAYEDLGSEGEVVWAWRQLFIVAQWVVLGERFGAT